MKKILPAVQHHEIIQFGRDLQAEEDALQRAPSNSTCKVGIRTRLVNASTNSSPAESIKRTGYNTIMAEKSVRTLGSLMRKIRIFAQLVMLTTYAVLGFIMLPWWLATPLTLIMLFCSKYDRKQKIDKSPEVLMYPVFD